MQSWSSCICLEQEVRAGGWEAFGLIDGEQCWPPQASGLAPGSPQSLHLQSQVRWPAQRSDGCPLSTLPSFQAHTEVHSACSLYHHCPSPWASGLGRKMKEIQRPSPAPVTKAQRGWSGKEKGPKCLRPELLVFRNGQLWSTYYVPGPGRSRAQAEILMCSL